MALAGRKVQHRARAVGFEYADAAGALADLEDELAELRAEVRDEPALETEADPRHFAELGDVLFAAVNVARRFPPARRPACTRRSSSETAARSGAARA